MSNKSDIKDYLLHEQWDELESALKQKPALIRHIMGFLYHVEEEMRWRAVKAFGIAAVILHDEKLKDLLRRMMWSMNDESGTCCWFIPQAVGEIGYQRPELIEDFLPGLVYFKNDPDEQLRNGVFWALDRIAEAGLEIPDPDDLMEPESALENRVKEIKRRSASRN
jgi:hypothetical protein